jgi:hypothetical protein
MIVLGVLVVARVRARHLQHTDASVTTRVSAAPAKTAATGRTTPSGATRANLPAVEAASAGSKTDTEGRANLVVPPVPEAAGERSMAEAMFAGDYARALEVCDGLRNAHPETSRYGVMARVLRTKAARTRARH